MRDSAFKRFLVSGYFSGREVWGGVRGMLAEPAFASAATDYDAYWDHREQGAMQPRFEIIAAGIQAGETVLDVGCGDGVLLAHLKAARAIEGIGVDLSRAAVDRARSRGVEARVGSIDAFDAAPAASFDHVVMSEVLEHVADPERFVRRGWSLARRTLWLTFPNIAYFPHRLRLLSGRFPVQWVVFPGEHLRFWSVPDFRRWLGQLGTGVPELRASNGVTLFGLHALWPMSGNLPSPSERKSS